MIFNTPEDNKRNGVVKWTIKIRECKDLGIYANGMLVATIKSNGGTIFRHKSPKLHQEELISLGFDLNEMGQLKDTSDGQGG